MFQGLRRFFALEEEMIEISIENVKRITVWLKPELLSRMDGWLETANCKNRSEFISKALRFYIYVEIVVPTLKDWNDDLRREEQEWTQTSGLSL